MSQLSPKTVYQALINAGASTVQAGGIMANMINESDFDPEAIGDNGTSFGLVQNHGAYSYLVTGNSTSDMNAQIALMKQQGAFAKASGSTIAQAAGNFAASYEGCVGCQAGGSQYNSRVANAATVQGWINSGNWPQSAGSPSSSGSTPTAQTVSWWNPLTWPSDLANALGNLFSKAGGDILGNIEKGLAGSAGNELGKIGEKIRADLWAWFKPLLIRLSLILFGAFIVYAGIQGLMKESAGPTDLTVGAVKEGAKNAATIATVKLSARAGYG